MTNHIGRYREYYAVLAASGLVLSLYLYITGTGIAGTFDSRHYLFAARSLRQTGQLLMPDGSPYLYWPPLYATILSLTGVAPVRWLNGLALLGALGAWSAVGYQVLPATRR
jgi:hypothetical protein